MRDYSKVSPLFWNGNTGRRLRGYADGQRVALYLFTCPSANMIGLYYLPLPTLLHEVGISEKGASKALRRVSELDFAHYDAPSEYVWVCKMAYAQMGLTLNIKDHRHAWLLKELETHRKSPFFNNFIDEYRVAFHLESIRPSQAPSKPLTKPLRSQEIEQEQEQKIEEEKAEGNPATPVPLLTLGEHGRVKLTAEQHTKLIEVLNGNLDAYVEGFDRWVNEAPDAKKDGIKRKDRHAYESIRSWYARDVRDGTVKPPKKDRKAVY